MVATLGVGLLAGCGVLGSDEDKPNSASSVAQSPAPSRPNIDARASMPSQAGGAVAGITYGAATPTATRRFAAATDAAEGVATSTSLKILVMDGRGVAGLGLYRVPKTNAASPIFQDQFVVQLMRTMDGVRSTKLVQIAGKPVNISNDGRTAGWFLADRAIILVRVSGPQLSDLVATVIKEPPK